MKNSCSHVSRMAFCAAFLLSCRNISAQYFQQEHFFPDDSVEAGIRSISIYSEDLLIENPEKTEISTFEYDHSGRITARKYAYGAEQRYVYDAKGKLLEEWRQAGPNPSHRHRRLTYSGNRPESEWEYFGNPPFGPYTQKKYIYEKDRLIREDRFFFKAGDSITPDRRISRIFEYDANGKCIRDTTDNGGEEWLYENGVRFCRIDYYRDPETGKRTMTAKTFYRNGRSTDFSSCDKDSVPLSRGKFEYNAGMNCTHSYRWDRESGEYEKFYTYDKEGKVTEERSLFNEKPSSRTVFLYDESGRLSEALYHDHKEVPTVRRTLVYTYY